MPQPPRPPRLQPQPQLPPRGLEAQRSDGGSRGLPPGGSGSGASGCGAAAASFVLLQEVSAVWPADNDPDAYHDATVIGLGLSAGNELRVTVRYDGYEGDQAVLRPGQLRARGTQRAAEQQQRAAEGQAGGLDPQALDEMLWAQELLWAQEQEQELLDTQAAQARNLPARHGRVGSAGARHIR